MEEEFDADAFLAQATKDFEDAMGNMERTDEHIKKILDS